MNKDDSLDNSFRIPKGYFDLEQPPSGHRDRFIERLGREIPLANPNDTHKIRSLWRISVVAAGLLLLVTVSGIMWLQLKQDLPDLSDYSPEISATSQHFDRLLTQKIRLLNAENSEAAKPIVNDALIQLKQMETDYQQMELDILNGGNSNLILKAMIQNFQTRIELIESVINQIENLKITHYENEIL